MRLSMLEHGLRYKRRAAARRGSDPALAGVLGAVLRVFRTKGVPLTSNDGITFIRRRFGISGEQAQAVHERALEIMRAGPSRPVSAIQLT